MKWISVEDRLPEIGEWVVARRGSKWPFTCRWRKERNNMFNGIACLDDSNNYRDPTHWMPLPEPPEDI